MEQRSKEWHDLRSKRIGSSDAPVVLGVSPWNTPYGLWMQKMGLSESTKDNEAMSWGRETEPMALELFNQLNRRNMAPQVFDNSWQMASLDGYEPTTNEFLEIKCPFRNESDHLKAKDGIIPEKYLPQIAHQFMLTKADRCYYFSFFKGDHTTIELTRGSFSSIYVDKLMDAEKRFWECMQEFTPPELSAKDYETDIPLSAVQAIKDWKLQKEIADYHSDLEKKYRELVLKECQNKNTEAAGVKITKIIRRGAVDYALIPEIQDIDLEQYRKPPVESWRLTNKKET